MTDTDLSTTYLGLHLENPVVASASPLTGDLDSLHHLADAGVGAVVLPSLFEEQIDLEAMSIHDGLEFGAGAQAEATGGYLPDLDDYNTGPSEYLQLIREAATDLDIPVIASLNGVTTGGWTSYAHAMEQAGAHALELNIYLIAADTSATAADVEDQYLRLVESVRKSVSVPLAVKIGPYFSSPGHMAHRLVEAGADGLVLFNRFYQPDIDLDELEVVPDIELSHSYESRLVLRWIAILRDELDASLAATTGIHGGSDVVKMILAGADVAMMTSALLMHGPAYVATVLADVEEWFTERSFTSVAQGRGSMSLGAAPNPSAYERANYMKTITSYASPS